MQRSIRLRLNDIIRAIDGAAATIEGVKFETFQSVYHMARTVDELKTALADSVDDYLEFCKERGEEPEKPLSGKFMLRVDPALHRAIAAAAEREGKSLNGWVKDQLAEAVER